MKKQIRIRTTGTTAASVIVAAVGLGACGSSKPATSAGGTVSQAGPLVWAVYNDVSGLDPQNNGEDSSKNIMGLVYEHLVNLSDGVHVSPQLATSYKEVSPTVYDFTIRRDVKFSNGRTMNVDDVVGSFKRLLSPKEASYLTGRLDVKSIRALSPSVVRFTLAAPNAAFLSALSDPAAAILPMKELDNGSFNPDKEMLGTGPYEVESHQQGAQWVFKRNPYYWQKGLPKIAQLKILVIADQGTELAALRSGAADIATFASSQAKSLASGIPNIKIVSQAGAEYYTLLLNEVASSQLKSRQTRQGINLALDRPQISSVALGAEGTPVGPASGLPNSCSASSLPFEQFSAAKASTYLSKGGRPTRPLSLIYDTLQPDEASIAQVIQTQLSKAGVKVTLKPLPDGQYLTDTFTDGTFDLAITFYSTGTDPYFGLIDWSPKLSGYTSKFSSDVPAIDSALAHVEAGSGPARTTAIAGACAAIDTDSGQLPLVSKDLTVAWNSTKLSATVLAADNEQNPLQGLVTWTLK